MRSLAAAVAVLLWLFLGYSYHSSHQSCCHFKESTLQASTIPVKKAISEPILYNWQKSTPVVSEDWDVKRNDLITGLRDNHKLEIIGYYDQEEKNTTQYDNLGIARATETAKLFKPDLTDEQMSLYGRLRSIADRDNPFQSVAFSYKMFTKSIQELDDKTLIYFPFNSTNKLNDEAVEAYLDKVAERVQKSGEIIKLSGHTDNKGDEDRNKELGQQRADIVRDYLLSQGVAAASIQTRSGGELEPVATNETEEGRAQNRRTELQIVKP